MKTIPENVSLLISLDESKTPDTKAMIDNLPVELTVKSDDSSDVPRLFVHGNPPHAVFIRPMGQCKIELVRRQGDTPIEFFSLEGCILHIRYDGCDYWFTLG